MNKEINIKKDLNYWECGDGCCSEWNEGVVVTLDDKIIFNIPLERGSYIDDESMYIEILKYLGYTVIGDVDNIYER